MTRLLATGAAVLLACGIAAVGRPASGETAHPVAERVVARFLSPETGGTARPRFVVQRVLAFEARLEAMSEKSEGVGDDYQERHVHAALDHHVAEEMLASLADKLIADLPPANRPSANDLESLQREFGGAMVERLGGRSRVEQAAGAEQLDPSEIDALLHRATLAAWYLDREVTPILHPSEEQLREVFRTSAHPYRGQRFEQVRSALGRWFVAERVRVAESAFLQAARSRVRVIVTR